MNDTKRVAALRVAADTLKELLEPGLLGNFTWFDAIQLTRFEKTKDGEAPVSCNVFSIFVAETGDAPPAPTSTFLSKPKTLKGLASSRFGVTRQPITPEQLIAALERYASTGVWQPFPIGPLQVGKLVASPHVFCPADRRTEVPLNSVLKNNFWAGSYVVELRDEVKAGLQELVDNDSMFEELSTWLETLLPLNIARVPDRIGNIVFQVPSRAIIAEYHRRPSAPVELRLAWEPGISPRPVSGEYRVEQDGLVVSPARFEYPLGRAGLNVPMTGGDIRFSVWDDQKKMLLAASAHLNASDGRYSVESRTTVNTQHPRRWEAVGPNGIPERHQVSVMEPISGWRGHAQPRRAQETDWRARRELRASMKRLVARRKFLQYGSEGSHPEDEQKRAWLDLRTLIRGVSQGAVYLWDPYLSANDILNTLAFSTDAATELRGLTAWKPLPTAPASTADCGKCGADPIPTAATAPASSVAGQAGGPSLSAREAWIAQQKATLDTAFIGDANLKLEYRMSWGVRGSFHDRFLIFPGLGRARTRVWSLGASINHIGTQHCIVQEVQYPEMVLDAFQRFWDHCAMPTHLIWKYE
ncbi:VPA1262 family N-terminal domain-containing protein [Achromobacter xylosoxidans]